MATRGRGGSGWMIATVFLGFGFFISLVLAIIFNMQINKARTAADSAETNLRRFVTVQLERSQDVSELANTSGNKSVVGVLLEQNSTLKNMIAGTSQVTPESISSDLDASGIPVPLLNEIKRLRAEEAAAAQRVNAMETELRDAIEARTAAIAARSQLQATYQQSLQDAERRLAAQQDQFTGYQSETKKKIDLFEDRIKELQNNSSDQVATLQATADQKEQEIDVLRRRLDDIQRNEGTGNYDPRILPDGKLISVIPDENLCYISLGKRDHLVLGLTFEVYAVDALIKINEVNELNRGKATIEVIDVAENSATCRVVRLGQRQILVAGDVIGNVVYDPNATIQFKIHGEFDIDNTGQATQSDRRRVENLVENWGGVLMDELTYATDYLVLGSEPEFPDPLPPDTIDPIEIARHAAAVKKFEEYQDLINTARELTIPVLNQNRFLIMIGYYRR